ncbi:amidohydrolase family protein [Nocardioides bizhenqiangii]|uniref:Amidohydrolase family protein n=1 Tax=Nocardioides bizhenqiangii TaxID=3095076 RepID=A0ABZ1A0I9_9ACTN|nr:amidohydrolase family protein [Nocardioides sp. HM61]WQQ28821.1 amidohydrolase family protein [Nocardioides sp. HM61]
MRSRRSTSPSTGWRTASTEQRGPSPSCPGRKGLDVETAFAAYTAGSAWINHLDRAGRVAPGYDADLVVLDTDPIQDPVSIGAATVVSTWIGGTAVYEA